MLEPEWISWSPDSPSYPNCPVEPGTDCEVRFAGGSTTRATMPESFEWWHESSCGDIIAYRVWSAKDDARALLVEAREELNNVSSLTGSAEWTKWTKRLGEIVDRIDAYLERNP